MQGFCILLCVGQKKSQCGTAVVNLVLINSLTFGKIIRCWPVSHESSGRNAGEVAGVLDRSSPRSADHLFTPLAVLRGVAGSVSVFWNLCVFR